MYSYNFNYPEEDSNPIIAYGNKLYCSLAYRLAVHTIPEACVFSWFMLDDYTPAQAIQEFGITQGNLYFDYDFSAPLLRAWVEDNLPYLAQCPICGCIFDTCQLCPNKCDTEDTNTPELEEALAYMVELYGDSNVLELLDDNTIYQVMLNDFFPAYHDALWYVIAPVVEEITAILAALDNAATAEEYLIAVMWANHAQHVNGITTHKYGGCFDLEYDDIESLSEEGATKFFGDDAIAELSGRFELCKA